MFSRIEESLNGGYSGIYGEIVNSDCYGLKTVEFEPDVIIDIGANVGVFTRRARELFPNALIVAVEPDAENFEYLTHFTSSDNVVFLKKALGQGIIYHFFGLNGSHECYLSSGIACPKEKIDAVIENAESEGRGERIEIETIMLDEIINTYVKPGQRAILKSDCEGAEGSIWSHEPSMMALKRIDYIAMELHDVWQVHALKGVDVLQNSLSTGAINELKQTHDCKFDGEFGIYFSAVKKR